MNIVEVATDLSALAAEQGTSELDIADRALRVYRLWLKVGSEAQREYFQTLAEIMTQRGESPIAYLAEQINKSPTVARAFEIVKSGMQADSGYAWSWHCNVAMMFVDAGGDRKTANVGAARFMNLCFGVDTSQLPEYAALGLDKE